MNMMFWLYDATIYAFSGLALYAAISDWRHFRIPNIISLYLILLWPVHLFAKSDITGWHISLIAAVILLLLGLVAFNKGMLGGGDVKFLSTATLWVPPPFIGSFLMITAIAGGVLCTILIGCKIFLKFRGKFAASKAETQGNTSLQPNTTPVLLQAAPYGIAIACGCLATAYQLLINP